ncbi:hypothetical protein GCM10018980_22900 [Streptomyces capoamus]|uniref:Uncharacterized protein n=1 Tax=Streptomyces capoamus TaxID=68183 RepID=A0A919C2L3_9ACTN|nr:hypothetical protein GCM10010501_00990 [Streptomyces libani subsp. rufus]GHG44722.1 hypothetical protein GCM10018980_22900 [Streptomyces capoamus]
MSAREWFAHGQLAGLRTRGHVSYEVVGDTYWPSLPRPSRGPVRMTAVVPAHRCGAVPDSHRVPSCDASRLADGANQLHGPAYGVIVGEESGTLNIRTVRRTTFAPARSHP